MKGWIKLPAVDGKSGCIMAPVCYCLVSETPFIPFFKDVLMRLLGTWWSGSSSFTIRRLTHVLVSPLQTTIEKIWSWEETRTR